jgi:hypothetical protein
MSYDPNASKGDRLICGCWSGDVHAPDCALGAAERVALAAVTTAAEDDGPKLIVALVALANAGMLRDLPAQDPTDVLDAKPSPSEVLLGVLDTLWESNLIGPAVEGGERR